MRSIILETYFRIQYIHFFLIFPFALAYLLRYNLEQTAYGRFRLVCVICTVYKQVNRTETDLNEHLRVP